MSVEPWWRGLQARVTLIYAVGALGLSVTVAWATFALAQNQLLSDFERTHRQQSYRNAVDVRQRLQVQAPIIEAGFDNAAEAVAAQEARAEEAEAAEAAAEAEALAEAEAGVDDDDDTALGDGETAAGATVVLTPDNDNANSGAATSTTARTVTGDRDEAGDDGETSDDGEDDDGENAGDLILTPAEEAYLAAEGVYTKLLQELRHTNGGTAIIVLRDGSDRGLVLGKRDIPVALQTRVDPIDGLLNFEPIEVAQMRYRNSGTTNYAIGISLDEVGVAYYEVVEMESLESTLGLLRAILFGVAALASIGGAALGDYSARIALSPLPRISSAAHAIAEGDFSTKLDMEADRDLAILTDAFNEMVDAVADRIDREQRFTSDVSHELRSPLMTLAASVEVLERRQESLPDVAQQAVELLGHDLRRFQRLVEDLLEVSRMEAGAVQIQLSHFRLREFLEQVLVQSQVPHLELICTPEDADVAITADKRRLAQVMTNLIENAEKYGDGATDVQFEVIGRNVQIVVSDLGPGVPVEHRERVFERFGRVEAGNRSAAPGFGLGLSLVAEHVRLHGGQVWVSDRVDGRRGARFVVQLPLGEHVDVVEEMAL